MRILFAGTPDWDPWDEPRGLPAGMLEFEPGHLKALLSLLLFLIPVLVAGGYAIVGAQRGKRRAALGAILCAAAVAGLYYLVGFTLVFLIPIVLAETYGIVAAFQGKRRAALGAALSIVVAAGLYYLVAHTRVKPTYVVMAVVWSVVLSPFTAVGVYGIIAAFRGKRRAAVRFGLWAAGPAALYCLVGGSLLLTGRVPDRSGAVYLIFLACGSLPFAAGFWAILLAYAVPEDPADRNPADVPLEPLQVPH